MICSLWLDEFSSKQKKVQKFINISENFSKFDELENFNEFDIIQQDLTKFDNIQLDL